MNRIEPIARDDLAEYEEGFVAIQAYMGFVPSSLRAMARVPRLLEGFTGLAQAVFLNDLLPDSLKQLIGSVTSAAAGCRYCQAHTAAHAVHLGVDEAKLAELWSFETSDRFDDAERGRAPARAARRSTPQRGHRRRLRRVPSLLHRRPDHRHRRGVRALRVPQPVERHHGHHPRRHPARSRQPRPRPPRLEPGEAPVTATPTRAPARAATRRPSR